MHLKMSSAKWRPSCLGLNMLTVLFAIPDNIINESIYKHTEMHDQKGCINPPVDFPHKGPGPRINIKTVLSTYGDFHVKDKTAVRTSYL